MSQNRTQMLMRWLCIMGELIFYISEGKIKNPKPVKKIFEELTDGRYVLKIEKRNKRSLRQNAYYFGCIVPLVKEGLVSNGFDDVKDESDAHEILKHLFLKRKMINRETEDVIEVVGSTKKLSTVEFNFFIEEIIKWGAEYLNIQIPFPNEQILMNF